MGYSTAVQLGLFLEDNQRRNVSRAARSGALHTLNLYSLIMDLNTGVDTESVDGIDVGREPLFSPVSGANAVQSTRTSSSLNVSTLNDYE